MKTNEHNWRVGNTIFGFSIGLCVGAMIGGIGWGCFGALIGLVIGGTAKLRSL